MTEHEKAQHQKLAYEKLGYEKLATDDVRIREVKPLIKSSGVINDLISRMRTSSVANFSYANFWYWAFSCSVIYCYF